MGRYKDGYLPATYAGRPHVAACLVCGAEMPAQFSDWCERCEDQQRREEEEAADWKQHDMTDYEALADYYEEQLRGEIL